jgi:hypothetical protein
MDFAVRCEMRKEPRLRSYRVRAVLSTSTEKTYSCRLTHDETTAVSLIVQGIYTLHYIISRLIIVSIPHRQAILPPARVSPSQSSSPPAPVAIGNSNLGTPERIQADLFRVGKPWVSSGNVGPSISNCYIGDTASLTESGQHSVINRSRVVASSFPFLLWFDEALWSQTLHQPCNTGQILR